MGQSKRRICLECKDFITVEPDGQLAPHGLLDPFRECPGGKPLQKSLRHRYSRPRAAIAAARGEGRPS